MPVRNMGPGTVRSKRGGVIQLAEVYAVVKEKGIPHPYERFCIMNALALMKITELDLSSLEYKIFLRLVAEMGIGNYATTTQSHIAEVYGVSRRAVNGAMANLKKHHLITQRSEEGPTVWQINPSAAWKGSTRNLRAALPAPVPTKRPRKNAAHLTAIEGGLSASQG